MNTTEKAELQERLRKAGNRGSPERKVAKEIAVALGETEGRVRRMIARFIAYVGEEKVRDLLAETLRIEEAGGRMVNDGSRRRTPGGLFFTIAKESMELPVRTLVFPPPRKRSPKPDPPADPAPKAE